MRPENGTGGTPNYAEGLLPPLASGAATGNNTGLAPLFPRTRPKDPP